MIAHLLRREVDIVGVQYRGTVDGLDVWAWMQSEPRIGGFGEGIEFGSAWSVSLNDRQYLWSDEGEHNEPEDAERALLAAVPDAIELYYADEREASR